MYIYIYTYIYIYIYIYIRAAKYHEQILRALSCAQSPIKGRMLYIGSIVIDPNNPTSKIKRPRSAELAKLAQTVSIDALLLSSNPYD